MNGKRTIHGIRHVVILFHHGSVVIGYVRVWSRVRSLPDSFVWWTAGLLSSAVVSCSLVDRGCWTVVSCGTYVLGNATRAVVWNPLERGGLVELLQLSASV